MKEITIRIKEENFLEDSIRIAKCIEKIWYPCIVSFRKDEANMSEVQRNYYFGVVVPIVMDYHGYEKLFAHNMLKCLFLVDYEEILQKMTQSTDRIDIKHQMAIFMAINSDLTITTSKKWEFEEYLKKIRSFYSEHQVFIPLPNEKWEWWKNVVTLTLKIWQQMLRED